MKRIIVLIVVCCSFSPLWSQDSTASAPVFRHELGLDATPFLTQFLSLTPGGFAYNPYFARYRFHLEKWALRAAVGGNVRTQEDLTNDTITVDYQQTAFQLYVGIERKTQLSRRWQCFFGLDLYWSRLNDKSDRFHLKIKESTHQSRQEDNFGVSPFLGFRFSFTERLSLTTSANLQIYYRTISGQSLFTPDTSRNNVYESSGWQSRFNSPLSVFFNFRF